MLLWFKDLMNVTEKLKFMDPTFRPSCLVSSFSGKVGVKLKNNFQCQKLISITDFFNSFKRYNPMSDEATSWDLLENVKHELLMLIDMEVFGNIPINSQREFCCTLMRIFFQLQ